MLIPVLLLLVFGSLVVLLTGFGPTIVGVFGETTWGFYSGGFFENVLVEAHGAIIDLLVVGVVLFWFEKRRDTADIVKSHEKELADLLFYRGHDASYRILGTIKRLAEMDITSFHLPEATLNDIEISDVALKNSNLRAANFSNTLLKNVVLENCECDAAVFNDAKFKHVTLHKVKLNRAKFQWAKLNGCDFSGCELRMADFTNADLRSAIFTGVDCQGMNFKDADLRNANFLGAKNLHADAFNNAWDTRYIKQ